MAPRSVVGRRYLHRTCSEVLRGSEQGAPEQGQGSRRAPELTWRLLRPCSPELWSRWSGFEPRRPPPSFGEPAARRQWVSRLFARPPPVPTLFLALARAHAPAETRQLNIRHQGMKGALLLAGKSMVVMRSRRTNVNCRAIVAGRRADSGGRRSSGAGAGAGRQQCDRIASTPAPAHTAMGRLSVRSARHSD